MVGYAGLAVSLEAAHLGRLSSWTVEVGLERGRLRGRSTYTRVPAVELGTSTSMSSEDPGAPTPNPTDDEPGSDPTDTDHPTGEDQAAENAGNEPPA
jgi:hypothetical protein